MRHLRFIPLSAVALPVHAADVIGLRVVHRTLQTVKHQNESYLKLSTLRIKKPKKNLGFQRTMQCRRCCRFGRPSSFSVRKLLGCAVPKTRFCLLTSAVRFCSFSDDAEHQAVGVARTKGLPRESFGAADGQEPYIPINARPQAIVCHGRGERERRGPATISVAAAPIPAESSKTDDAGGRGTRRALPQARVEVSPEAATPKVVTWSPDACRGALPELGRARTAACKLGSPRNPYYHAGAQAKRTSRRFYLRPLQKFANCLIASKHERLPLPTTVHLYPPLPDRPCPRLSPAV